MLPKLFFTKVAKNGDCPGRISSRDIGQLVQCKAKDAYACPAPARASEHLGFSDWHIPQRPIRVGNGSGPAARPI